MKRIYRLLCCFSFLFFITLKVYSQNFTVSIFGPSTSTVGTTDTYHASWTENGSGVSCPSSDAIWIVDGAQSSIISQNCNDMTIQWPWTGGIYMSYEGSTWDNYYATSYFVTVTNGVPLVPDPNNATNITATSFTASWNPATYASSYRLYVSRDINFTNLVIDNLQVVGTSYQVTGLTAGTQYYYRVRGENSYGVSNVSGMVPTLTVPSAPSTSAYALDMSSTTVSWSSVQSATSYLLDVSADGFSSFVGTYHDRSVTGSNLTITGLAPGTAYNYRMRAVNNSGPSSYSNTGTVATMDCSTYHQFSLSMISPSGAICYPQSITLRATRGSVLNGTVSGEFRLYDNTGWVSTAQMDSQTFSGDLSYNITSSTTLWVTFHDNISGCETARVPFTVTMIQPASISQQYGNACRGLAKGQLNSDAQGASFLIYKLVSGQSYEQIQSTSGYFEINDFQASEADGVYFAKVNQPSGCFAANYFPLHFDILPTAPPSVTPGVTICQGSTQLTASGSASEYRWFNSSGGQVSGVAVFNTPSDLPIGSTTFMARGYSDNGNCVTDPAYATVNILARPVDGQISANTSTICTNQSVTISSTGGTGTPHYWCSSNGGQSWNIFSDQHVGESSFTFTPPSAGTFRILLRNQTSCGVCGDANNSSCTSYRYVDITVVNPPPVSISQAHSGSFTQSAVTMTSSLQGGGYTYEWQQRTSSGPYLVLPDGNHPSYNVTQPGIYLVKVISSSGCQSTSAEVTVNPNNYNYIITNVVLVSGVTDASQIAPLTIDNLQQTIAYFDGLGRPMQNVTTQGSPNKKDVVVPIIYDAFGRESRKYLPVTSGSDGWYKSGLLDANNNYIANLNYNNGDSDNVKDDTRPFSETVFEASPLNRPLKDYGPGLDWNNTNVVPTPPTIYDKPIVHQYLVNSAATEQIIAWDMSSSLPQRSAVSNPSISGGYYTTGQLTIKSTTDEQNHEVREYTDKAGHVILKKVQAVETATLNDPTHWTQTYYIYDNLDLLRYVLQPELVKTLVQNGTNPTPTDLNNFAFQYQYDGRKRMTQKQVPGSGAVYMVYDMRDRLVMTQDANQRPNYQWLLTKYDVLNRPVITALYTHSSSVDQATMGSLIDQVNFYETYNGVPASNGYTSNVWPVSGYTVLTATYYDNYDFVNNLGLGSDYNYLPNDIAGQESTSNAVMTGKPTGTKVNVLNSSNYLWSVTYFDNKYRVIQNISQNNKGGWDRVTNVVDFSGRVMNTKTTHRTSTHPGDQVVAYRYTYDHASRRVKTYQALNNEPNEMLLSQNDYNELGQLVEKNLHLLYDAQDGQSGTLTSDNITVSKYNGESNLIARNSVILKPNYVVTASSTPYRAAVTGVTQAQAEANGRYFQSVDYRYNIRGWLTSMNNSQLANDQLTNDDGNDLFGFELGYNKSIGTGNASAYNGNISAMKWSSNMALGTVKDVAYNYSYDALNRITAASYLNNTAGVWANATGQFNESGYQYDQNGNIRNLVRNGSTGSPMDNLTYTYSGNQLLTVTDAGDVSKGFADGNTAGNDYSYDFNGNMVTDKNKSLTASNAILYNHLNLPVQVTKSTNEKIVYTYNAAGIKLTQQVYNASNVLTKTTEYDGPFIYQGDTLQFINHEEGRVVMKDVSAPEYQYHLKDHLGNVRVTFTTAPARDANSATYEAANANVEQSKFLRYTNARRIYATIFDHTNGSSPGYAERLSASANEIYGLARSISVMPGDVVQTEVYAKYVDTNSANWTTALNTLMGQIASNNTSVVLDGSAYTSSTSSFPAAYAGLVTKSDNGAPKAYLNWLVFDRNFVFLTGGFRQITTICKEAGTDVAHEYLSSGNITITQPGYVYIYLSNEAASPVEVFFDDFKVTQTKSPVVQQEDYYPFGLTFNSYSRENSVPNKYQYNGKENIADLGLNWDDYGARMYMPELGRWGVVDEFSSNAQEWSPYRYGFDNPARYRDENGGYEMDPKDAQKYQALANYLKKGIQGVLNEKRIVNALMKYGQFTEGQIRDDLQWGNGPHIEITSYIEEGGEFRPDEGSRTISISKDWVEKLKSLPPGKERDMMLFRIASVILHEYVHFGDDQKGNKYRGEEGQDFERAAYGRVITEHDHARQLLNRWLRQQDQQKKKEEEENKKKGEALNNLLGNFGNLAEGVYEWNGSAFVKK